VAEGIGLQHGPVHAGMNEVEVGAGAAADLQELKPTKSIL
jgi:hypothetical protein